MALAAATVWEVRTTGNDANGGGFVTGAAGTDRSQQDAPHVVIDGVTITCTVNATTTKLDITGYTTTAADVGNIVQITGGTMTAGFYQITAQTGGTQWTVDRAAGTAAQTGTGNMGGALATPGKVMVTGGGACTVSGMKVYIKAGTYTLSTTTPGAGGPVNPTVNLQYYAEGYQTTRGDLGTRPIIHAGAQTNVVMWQNNTATTTALAMVVNVELNGNSGAGNNGFGSAQPNIALYRCIARNFNQAATNYGFNAVTTTVACEAYDCALGFNGSSGRCHLCYAKDCTVYGFNVQGHSIVGCIANHCAIGFKNLGGTLVDAIVNCVAYNCTDDGFSLDGGGAYVNCVATANTGYGFGGSATARQSFINCATYSNTSGSIETANPFFSTPTALSGDPFIDAANGDFRPDNTASEGALLRDTGVGVITQTDNRDIGAVQHADPAAGGVNRALLPSGVSALG